LFGTTRIDHPGEFAPDPLRPYTSNSFAVFDSCPGQKGQFFGSPGTTSSRRKSMGRFPRSVEIITHRAVIGSFLNSGNSLPPKLFEQLFLNLDSPALYRFRPPARTPGNPRQRNAFTTAPKRAESSTTVEPVGFGRALSTTMITFSLRLMYKCCPKMPIP